MNKQKWLAVAEVVDSLRIFPRLFLLSCFWWAVYVTYQTMNWYMALPKDERGLEASGTASIIFVSVLGFLKLVYGTYTSAGRDWNGIASSSTTATVTTVTEKTP